MPVTTPPTIREDLERIDARSARADHRRPDEHTWAGWIDARLRILDGPMRPAWALGLAAAWVLLFPAAVALEPVPAEPSAPEPWYALAIGLVLLAGLGGVIAGCAVRRRWAAAASLVAAGAFGLGVILCPSTGHHSMGAWWFAEAAAATGLAGVSVAALRRA